MEQAGSGTGAGVEGMRAARLFVDGAPRTATGREDAADTNSNGVVRIIQPALPGSTGRGGACPVGAGQGIAGAGIAGQIGAEQGMAPGLAAQDFGMAGPEGRIRRLHPRDRIRQDGAAIALIYRNLGTAAADQMVSRALGELGLLMADLADQLRRGDLMQVLRQLRKVQAMAASLGMQSLAQVAEHARGRLEQADGTGFAAVWARLLRITERSLSLDHDSGDPG